MIKKELIQRYNLIDYLKKIKLTNNSYSFLDRWMTEGKNNSGGINNYTTIIGQIENLQQLITVRNNENFPTKDIDAEMNTEAGLYRTSAEIQNSSRKTSPKMTSCSPEVIRGTRLDSDSNNTSTVLKRNNKIKRYIPIVKMTH